MASDRYDQLAPRDVAITLRSLGRRFGTVAQRAADPTISDQVDAPGPDGRSLTDLVVGAARHGAFLANEVQRSLDHEDPVIPAAALDADERTFVDERDMALADAAASVADDGEAAGSAIDGASATAVGRTVRVAGGGETTPLELGREMARTCIGLLTAAERRLDDLAE